MALLNFYEASPLINNSANLSVLCGLFFSDPNNVNQRFTLFDASGIIPSGIQNGNFFNLGNFDQCLETQNRSASGQEYHGKYCLATFGKISPFHVTSLAERKLSDFGWQIGECMPDFCSLEDFSERFPNGSFEENHCYTQSTLPKLGFDDKGAVFTLTIIAFFALLVVMSTLYELYLQFKKIESCHLLLVAFSALTNGRKIFSSSKDPNQLPCLNGIKAISLMWIIFYHEYDRNLYSAYTSITAVDNISTNKAFMFSTNGSICVDSFFAVGGLLTVYSYMRSCDKGIKYNVLESYIHRYFRLTPVLLVEILLHLYLVKYISSGPFSFIAETLLTRTCRWYWWAALLYIQNFIDPIMFCVGQTWYIMIDMQLFVLSPILLLPLRKHNKLAIYTMYVLIVLGIAVPMTISSLNHYEVFGSANMKGELLADLYFATYTRFGPYVIGMLTGYHVYLLRAAKTKLEMKLWTVLIAWISILTVLLFCLYGPAALIDSDKWILSSIFNGTFRSAWAIAVSLIAYLCIAGYGGLINAFLSIKPFQVLAKLSYSMYICHACVITLRVASSKFPNEYNHFKMMFDFCGDYVITLVISFFLCIMFELPFITIEKYFVIMLSYPIKKSRCLFNHIKLEINK